jgi:arylformamidase
MPTGPDEVAYVRREGTDASLTSLDVYLPAGCGPVPVLVWIHGGGWRRGDKAGVGVDEKVALAHRLGAALVSVNYRLSGPESTVVWPDHGDDIAAAVRWIASEGDRWGLDGSSMVIMGHSAGAHLALMAVLDPGLVAAAGPGGAAVRCVVALDTAAFDLGAQTLVSEQLVGAAFGDDPGQRASASPLVAVSRHGAGGAELVVVTQGSARRVEAASAFVDAVVAAGGTATLAVVEASHQQVNTLLGAGGDTVVTPVVEPSLSRCLADGPR